MELEQENQIRNDWQGLKEGLRLRNLLKDGSKTLTAEAQPNRHWLVNLLGVGTEVLTKKILDNTGEKISTTVEKGMDAALDKLDGYFNRRKRRRTGN